MRWHGCVCLSGVVLGLVLAGMGPAGAVARAASRPITGQLSVSGYTVIALAGSGRASSVPVRGTRFSLRPPSGRVTLHLRARSGLYAGPIVVATADRGRRAIEGVRAGARLGRILIDRRRGYARVRRALTGRLLDATLWARARNGVPIGARDFGRVLSRNARGPASDPDRDGIPNPLDVDDDGDLILDNLDRSTAARSAQAPSGTFGLHSELPLPLEDSVNADAGSTAQQIDAALRIGQLDINILPGDTTELDCGGNPNPSPPPPRLGGLVYCSTGGTGRAFAPGVDPADWAHFPDCCDPDNDGYGTLTPTANTPGGFFLRHGADSTQIRTGDVLIERVTTGGVESQFTATVPFVFATSSALASYSDTAGHSGSVSYPVAAPNHGIGGGPGTAGNPFPVAAGSDGHVVLTLTYWRPQRRAIAPETGQWIDMGGLSYAVGVRTLASRAPGPVGCPQAAYSSPSPGLAPASPDVAMLLGGGALTDSAADQPASSANRLTFTVDVTQCLASQGFGWDPGQQVGLELNARSGAPDKPDNTIQNVTFKRES